MQIGLQPDTDLLRGSVALAALGAFDRLIRAPLPQAAARATIAA